MFPYLKWLDSVTGLIPRLKALSTEFDAFLDQVIEEHAEENHKNDFVSIIMQLQKDGMFEIDRDKIKATLLDIFIGGTETSTTTTEWMMSELLKHPHVMKKVQQEVRDVVGNKSKVDMEDISKMEYLKCVLKETFRLHPPAVFSPRKTSATAKLGGYDIPSDTTVMINIWAIQRDPKWWENPEEFIPERFEKSSIDFKGEYFHFIPFGFGRRRCPGIPFGVASIEYMMANLLCWFDWKLPAGEIAENLDMTEIFGFTVTKKTPLLVQPTSRLSL
ncbi:cytochrome P450, family 71, subfamily B, polypeptide 14 [Hibiscus trionum]|uniref:Cytochrome P450, family 71, subfamily B, polypeptide 14 n=1 Tax=Hibiscus trionum TaxID=183268 RepID=A0A9W7LZF6_HIBTR|nr:cytochrome P450, family 71, subfamily B, polypeptide 14 [Hibiscus trionum]